MTRDERAALNKKIDAQIAQITSENLDGLTKLQRQSLPDWMMTLAMWCAVLVLFCGTAVTVVLTIEVIGRLLST